MLDEVEKPARLHPDMEAALRKNRENVPNPLDVTRDPIAEVRADYLRGRAYWNEDVPDLPKVSNFVVPAPAGEMAVRLYCPRDDATPLPVLLYCHGGGFVYGNLDSHDNICRQIASRSGWAVLAIDYHLAPEHKFPTPLQDVAAVIDWFDKNAEELGLDADCVAMGGDSAGAGITVGVALELKEIRPDYLKMMILVYGNHGLGNDCRSVRLYGGEAYGLDDDKRAFYRASYYSDPGDADDPRNAQLTANLSGLPPAFIGMAEMDPLHDNGPAIADALAAAGVESELKTYSGVLHGFLHYTRMCRTSIEAHDDIAAALKRIR